MIEAVVQTGSFETTYRRAGAGPALLLLDAAGPATAEWLFGALAARFRVVAPVRPGQVCAARSVAAPEGFHAWLRGVIDGLGLDRPAVVAGEADGPALDAFAAIDPHRLGRIALVPDPAPLDVAGRRAAVDALIALLEGR